MFENRRIVRRKVKARPLDVRRLAALDLHGWSGTHRRRWIVLFEFAGASLGGLGLGLWTLAAATSPRVRLFGLAMIGIGCNFVPLTLYAVRARRQGTLSAELEGVDLGPELRRYSLLALWLVVPFLVAALSVIQRRSPRGAS